MAKMVDKFLGFFGVEEDDLEKEEVGLDEYTESSYDKPRRNTQVLSLHSQRQTRVVIMEPRVFDEAQTAADHLKNRRPVILNFEETDLDLAKRIVDFTSGAAYALDGKMQKIGQTIFLFVPSNFEIAGEIGNDLREKAVFPWINRL